MIRKSGSASIMLTIRQEKILEYVKNHPDSKRSQIEQYIKLTYDVSKVTVLRDLDVLTEQGYIEKHGFARSVSYRAKNVSVLLKKYDVEKYFETDSDERKPIYEQFNFDVFNNLKNIFSKGELKELSEINDIYNKKIRNISHQIRKKEFERLLIELSWKSSKIEGNTYSLLDTENLIKNNVEATGHKKEESIMILNHKKALDFIFEQPDYFKEISLKKLEELHYLLTEDLNVKQGLRETPVGIVGTKYKPLFNKHQITEAVEKLILTINETKNVIEKAIIAVLMISYIQPFEDGNKRTGRILANAILFANSYCPLSYRSVNEVEYKKAVIIFYETNSISYFKDIFVEQFKFAVEQYF